MALDFFKKKPEVKKAAKKAVSVTVKEELKKPADEKKPVKITEKPSGKALDLSSAKFKVSNTGEVLRSALITEKAVFLAEQNQYAFKVFPRTNKFEIKRAVQSLFGVEVESVRIINVPRKAKRIGKVQGFRGEYKKALVRVKAGQKIEVLPR